MFDFSFNFFPIASFDPRFLVFGLFFVLAGSIFVISYLIEKKRTEKWQSVATDMGFDFQEIGQGLQNKYHFNLFGLGRSRKCRNILSGNADDTAITITDYQYTTGGGKNSSTYKMTVCILENPDLNLPQSALKVRSFFDFVPKKGYGAKFKFEDDTEFAKKFLSYGSDESEINRLYNNEVKNLCLKYHDQGISVETYDNSIMVYFRKRIKPENVQELLQVCFTLHGLWSGA